MRNVLIGKLVLLILLMHSLAFGQFVTLEGKQFKLNGSDFYPLVMNYGIDIVHNKSTTDYYASPSSSFGSTSEFECYDVTTCNDRLQIDFAKIAAMGFNTIRFGAGLVYRDGPTPGSRVFSMKFNDKSSVPGQQYLETDQFRDFAPGFADQASIDYFNIIKNVLTEANSVGLKVIFVTGGPGPRDAVSGIPMYNFVHDSQAAADYAVYLAKLSSEISNYPALLAYDLFNEPIYNDMYYEVDATGHKIELTKQQICAYEHEWYDAVKPYPASPESHPLVTLGGASVDEVFYWDMSMLKLDFYSVHCYPEYNQYIYPTDPQQSIQDGMSRFKDIMFWLGKVCPIPWIVGETGFSADDNAFEPYQGHLDNDPAHHLPPYMYGSEAQQEQFIQQSLADARNAGASGYSWWSYQNVYWFSHGLPHGSDYPKCMNEDFFGLLHYGDGTVTNWSDKKVVTDNIFHNYLNSAGQPPIITPLQQPPGYYDPYNIHAILNTNATNAISGYVLDDKGNPIKSAVVKGVNWLETVDNNGIPGDIEDSYIHSSLFTITDEIGHFELIPYNYFQSNVFDPNRIVNIQVTSTGAERDCEGFCNWPFGEIKMTQTSFSGISIKEVKTGYDAIASNEIVFPTESRNYNGWNTFTARNLTLNGISNLSARNSVKLESEFHARYGCHVHIFLSDGFLDCNNFFQFMRSAQPAIGSEEGTQTDIKEIEVVFGNSNTVDTKIYPNPSSGDFTINIQKSLNENCLINVQNLLGEVLWSSVTKNHLVNVNLNLLPKGFYLVQIHDGNRVIVKKIVIN